MNEDFVWVVTSGHYNGDMKVEGVGRTQDGGYEVADDARARFDYASKWTPLAIKSEYEGNRWTCPEGAWVEMHVIKLRPDERSEFQRLIPQP